MVTVNLATNRLACQFPAEPARILDEPIAKVVRILERHTPELVAAVKSSDELANVLTVLCCQVDAEAVGDRVAFRQSIREWLAECQVLAA